MGGKVCFFVLQLTCVILGFFLFQFHGGENMDYTEIRNAIYTKVDELFDLAQKEQQTWVECLALREAMRKSRKLPKSDKTHYELKIDTTNSFFAMSWIDVEIYKTHTGKYIRKTRRIKTPKNHKYDLSKFPKATEFEIEQIVAVENNLKPIRKQVSQLAKMHNSLIYAARASGDNIEVLKLKDRVDFKITTISEIKRKYLGM